MADDVATFEAQHTSPPRLLVQRPVTVQLEATNALRYPGDEREGREAFWFERGVDTGGRPREREQPHPVTRGNRVRFLVDGVETLRAMEARIAQTGAAGDFIYMLNWWADPTLRMTGSNQRLARLLGAASDRGVEIRGMFWHMFGDDILQGIANFPIIHIIRTLLPPWHAVPVAQQQNQAMVDFINTGSAQMLDDRFDKKPVTVAVRHVDPNNKNAAKRVGAAIFDRRLNVQSSIIPLIPTHLTVGSHHQKVLVVRAGGRLFAFCGGIDFNRDRIDVDVNDHHGAPLHDVHCEVQGPAAGELLSTFVQRWTDHPDVQELPAALRGLAGASVGTPPPDPAGRLSVQMGRTFGRGPLFEATVSAHPQTARYRFAPSGEGTARRLIGRAILGARKFIYLEDQYFVNEEAADLLATAAGRVAHITIVLPHHEIGDMPDLIAHRRKVIKKLKQQHPERIRIFYRCGPGQTPGDAETYVHAKTTIVDDEIAIIGTVNYSRRSWNYDSEVCLGLYDPSSDQVLTSRLARWLRMRLWREHLFGAAQADRGKGPPSPPDAPSAGVADRQFAELFDGVAAGALWQRLIDLKRSFLLQNPQKPIPVPGPKGTILRFLRPRDSGYVQEAQTFEPLTQSAMVRPYDEDDDPPGTTVLAMFYDQFVDPG